MNSILLPEMQNILEPSLALLAIIVPLGLAYLFVMYPERRKGKERSLEDGAGNKPGEFR